MKELPKEVLDLDEKIIAFIRKGLDHQDSEEFNQLALQVFELQFKYIPIYRRYCEKRGVSLRRRSLPGIRFLLFPPMSLK